MIEITNDPIDTEQVLKSVGSVQAGASVLFVGTTRQFTQGKETLKLDYECYREMAIKKMSQLRDQAMDKWQVENCTIVHRIGTLELGEASIAVAVSTPHRSDGFEAAQWLVDTLKKEVPIWKREHWADGSDEWVHPDDAIVAGDSIVQIESTTAAATGKVDPPQKKSVSNIHDHPKSAVMNQSRRSHEANFKSK